MLCNEGSSFHFSKDDSYFIHEGRKVRLIERNGLYFIRLNDVLEKSEVDRLVMCEVELGNSLKHWAHNLREVASLCKRKLGGEKLI
jgi:hypothetical protein